MRYPASFLEQLKNVASVSSVVGARLPIKRHGREFQALCPFHKEKSPSFTINDEKGFYHCFGCGAHGDAIGFIKEYEGINYKEAIEKLASELGLALPQPTREAVAQDKRRRSLQDICEMACRWFESQLTASGGFAARDYLEKRGLNADTIQQFRLGFAPDDRGAMARALMAEGVTQQELLAAGLLIQPDDAGREAYARFRGRIIFPIRDRSSKVIAFGGRLLGSHDSAPKYLNSPETELFHKGAMLYNFDLARRAARDAGGVLVCEGYMDVIALAQAGLSAAVAPLGTAITATQLQQLWQLTDEPVLCLDGDAAGLRAMNRAAELALPALTPGKSLRFMMIPAGEDPDTLVRAEGKTAFMARAAKATPLVKQITQPILAQSTATPEERAGQEATLMQLVERIENELVKTHYKEHVRNALWARNRPKSAKKSGGMKRVQNVATTNISAIPYLPGSGDLNSRKIRALLRGFALLMAHPELSDAAEADWFLSELEMPDAGLRALQETALAKGLARDTLLAACSAPIRLKLTQELQVLARQKSEDPRLGAQLWQQMLGAYRQACLMEDYSQAEREMAEAMTPERWDRFTALKAELESLSQQQQAWQSDQMLEHSE
jgi:DNA primase